MHRQTEFLGGLFMTSTQKSFILQVVKAVALACIAIMVAVLLFAVIVKLFVINDIVITIVNYCIKAAAIFLGVFFFIKDEQGWLKGLIIGLSAAVIIFFIFAIISSSIRFAWLNLLDFVICAVLGLISGVITQIIKN